MPRPKKPIYEYVEKLDRYRKRIKDADGKYVAIYGKTPDELTRKIAESEAQIKEAKYRRENPTVKEYAEKWLTMQSANIRASTLVDYTSCVKIYIIGTLGERFMCEVTADDVKMAITKAADKSASVYRKTQMLFKQIFRSAEDSGVIDQSPCEKLNPRGGKPALDKVALTKEQESILVESVTGLPVYPFVMLGLYAGLRREESLALKWECVVLNGDAPHISVRRTWHIENNRPVIEDELKSKAAKRDIPIPPKLRKCLEEVKASSKSEYVIANSDGGPLSGTQWQRLWKYVVTRTTKERTYTRYGKDGERVKHTVTPILGQKAPHNNTVVYSMDFIPTPHQLRHTYITNLLLAGVDVKTVQYLAGHEHAKITLDIYAHLTYNRPVDLKDKVNKAFSG